MKKTNRNNRRFLDDWSWVIYNNTKYRDIITEKGREHSRKPDCFYDMVNDICLGSKLDYFSREQRSGWYNYGNEINKFK